MPSLPKLNVTKLAHVVTISREQMNPPKPTQEERDRWEAEWVARVARRERALANAPEPLQSVIKHHSSNNYSECNGCDVGSYAESGAYWPCSTIELIVDMMEPA